MNEQTLDVAIIGAGISGIGAACNLSMQCPDKDFAVFERRSAIGGTWDLFRYPGIRSDSDMFSFGFSFRPWTGAKTLAPGNDIRQYVTDTADEYGVTPKIQFNSDVHDIHWQSEDNYWHLTVSNSETGEDKKVRCRFLLLCTGYYKYSQGFAPEFAGSDNFKGDIIHPQHWPENYDYSGKKVVVIGSGATAVTLIPAMADKTAHITMLQRSPTYIGSLPAEDKSVYLLKKILPEKLAYKFIRKRNIWIAWMFYKAALKFPNFIKKHLLSQVKRRLPDGFDMKHFTPQYNPWDERFCIVPDGDLFKSIRDGKASVVTDHIDHFTATGIQLKSGEHLEADTVITATGLNVSLLDGMTFAVDGEQREHRDLLVYKSVMVADAPNIGVLFGYTNAPWPLKVDIAATYLCRLIKYMDKNGYQVAVPVDTEGNAEPDVSVMDETLKSGYAKRASANLPRQGKKSPWKVLMHYRKDKKILTKDEINDGVMQFE